MHCREITNKKNAKHLPSYNAIINRGLEKSFIGWPEGKELVTLTLGSSIVKLLSTYNPGRATISSIATIKKIDEPGCNVYGLKGQQNSLLFFEEKIPLI